MNILYEYIENGDDKINMITEQRVLEILPKMNSEFIGFTKFNNAIYAEPHSSRKGFSVMDIYKDELFDSNDSYQTIMTQIASTEDVKEKLDEVNTYNDDASISNGISICYARDIVSKFDENGTEVEYRGKLYNSFVIKCTNTDISIDKPIFGLDVGIYNTQKILSFFVTKYVKEHNIKLTKTLVKDMAGAIVNEFVKDPKYSFYLKNVMSFYNPYVVFTGFTAGFKRLNEWNKYNDLHIRPFRDYPYNSSKGEFELKVINMGELEVDNDTFEKLVMFQNSIN